MNNPADINRVLRITNELEIKASSASHTFTNLKTIDIKEFKTKKNVEVSTDVGAISKADVVILAVPDITIGKTFDDVSPQMTPGAVVLTLDPAAPLDGVIHHREDLGYVIAPSWSSQRL